MPLWLISLIIGVVIGLVVVSVLKSQLKSVSHQSGAGSYQVDGSLRLTVSTDMFLYQNTTRIPRAKSKK